MGGGEPAVCCRAEGGKGTTTFLLGTPVAVTSHAGLPSRCKIRGGVQTKRRKICLIISISCA